MSIQFNSISYLLAGILLFAGLIFVFYQYIYKPSNKATFTAIDGIYPLDQNFEATIPFGKFASDRDNIVMPGYGHGLTFSWGMYLEQVGPDRMWSSSYAKDKPILRIGNSPHIYYNPKYNILKVQVSYKETPFFAHYPIIELRDIPLQRWNKFVVVIQENKVKIYFNGKLVVNKKLANEPLLESTDIILGEKYNNIIGKIQDFKVYFRPYDNRDIKALGS
jgi:hypothetical protein